MPASATPTVFTHLPVLGDLTRTRILLLLEGQELTVAELCIVLQIPQSTVSRHLKALADGGWVTARAEGTSRLYRGVRDAIEPAAARLWQVVRDEVADTASALQDGRRLERVLSDRRSKSQQFFTTSAGQWDKLRGELFGGSFHFSALLGLLDPDWTVGDLGCGTGQVAEALAPCRASHRRRRFRGDAPGGETSRADPPQRRGETRRPRGVADRRHIARRGRHACSCSITCRRRSGRSSKRRASCRPGGRLLLADMMPHDREAYRHQMGHVWLGFSESRSNAISPTPASIPVASVRFHPTRRRRGPRSSPPPPHADPPSPRVRSRTGARVSPPTTIDEGESR